MPMANRRIWRVLKFFKTPPAFFPSPLAEPTLYSHLQLSRSATIRSPPIKMPNEEDGEVREAYARVDNDENILKKIVKNEAPADVVYEDEQVSPLSLRQAKNTSLTLRSSLLVFRCWPSATSSR